MKTQITQEEYYQACALKTLINEKYKELEAIQNIFHNIFGTNKEDILGDSGWIIELGWDDKLTVDKVIKKLNISIIKNEPKTSKKTKKTTT